MSIAFFHEFIPRIRKAGCILGECDSGGESWSILREKPRRTRAPQIENDGPPSLRIKTVGDVPGTSAGRAGARQVGSPSAAINARTTPQPTSHRSPMTTRDLASVQTGDSRPRPPSLPTRAHLFEADFKQTVQRFRAYGVRILGPHEVANQLPLYPKWLPPNPASDQVKEDSRRLAK